MSALRPADSPDRSFLDTRDNNCLIAMSDGYQIGVSMNDDATVRWLPCETGDMVTCATMY